MTIGRDWNRVKVIHSSALKAWTRFPEYRHHKAQSLSDYHGGLKVAEAVLWELRELVQAQEKLAQLHVDAVPNADEIEKLRATLSAASPEALEKLAEAKGSPYRQPVLFISHRWDAAHHPDPEGVQLRKLQALKDCFLIYDYSSFPQDTTAAKDREALQAILSGMNALISNVVVLTAPDFLERGWCIYEYVVASMRASIVCDELNDPNFVMLRNLAATIPPSPPLSQAFRGHSIESCIQNAKNQGTLKTIGSILPLFNKSNFTLEHDREIVRNLLIAELMEMLPGKKEYVQYLGEWITKAWTEDELRAAFTSGLNLEPEQVPQSFRPFEPKVPSTLPEAVINRYRLDEMPRQNEWTWATLLGTGPFAGLEGIGQGLAAAAHKVALIVAGVIALLLAVLSVLLFLLVRRIFF